MTGSRASLRARVATVSGNTVRGNNDLGLKLGVADSYLNNNVTNNIDGGVSGGTSRGGNFCYGNAVVSSSCP